MNEDRFFERRQDAADRLADGIERARENRVWELTRKGGDMYPLRPENIQKAVSELTLAQLSIVDELREASRADAGLYLLELISDYWDAVAQRDAERSVTEPEDDWCDRWEE